MSILLYKFYYIIVNSIIQLLLFVLLYRFYYVIYYMVYYIIYYLHFIIKICIFNRLSSQIFYSTIISILTGSYNL